jgi:hypothetical protein
VVRAVSLLVFSASALPLKWKALLADLCIITGGFVIAALLGYWLLDCEHRAVPLVNSLPLASSAND